MPQTHPPDAPNVLRELQRQQRDFEERLRRLEGRRTTAMDRLKTADVPAPMEGQLAVEAATDKARYYANGEWRDFAGEAGTYRNPTVKYGISGIQWAGAPLYTTLGVTVVIDAASPGGGYVQINGGDQRYFCIGMFLGPAGSSWAIRMAYQTGPDCGKITFDWQTTSADPTFSGTQYENAVGGPESLSSTWYLANSGRTTHQDLYAAVAGTDAGNAYEPITIAGADGDMLSAVGSAGPGDYGLGTQSMNGGGDGSVVWWLRVRVNGKNASSSAFRARIYSIEVVRAENDTGFAML